MNLYLDIETIPGQAPWIREEVARTVKHPGQMKKAETIANWEKTQKSAAIDKEWLKTGLIGTLGEIICMSWAIDDGKVQSVRRALSSPEAPMLAEFFKLLEPQILGHSSKQQVPTTWIGHNVTSFDLRFLWQRCVIGSVKPTVIIPINVKPWEGAVYDTFTEWAGYRSNGGSSLTAICKALGIPDEDTIDGSQVWEYVSKGDIDTVVKHCEIDIHKVRLVHKRLTFQC